MLKTTTIKPPLKFSRRNPGIPGSAFAPRGQATPVIAGEFRDPGLPVSAGALKRLMDTGSAGALRPRVTG
jgi:hypothetical protein